MELRFLIQSEVVDYIEEEIVDVIEKKHRDGIGKVIETVLEEHGKGVK